MRKALVSALLAVLLVWTAVAVGQTVKKPVLDQINVPPPTPILKPDLFINKVWFAKWVENPNASPLVPITGSLKLGVKVWLVCDLVNQGHRNITSLWLLGFYVDDVMVWNNSWGNLDAGKTLRGLGPYTPSVVGTHNLRCMVDANKQITESNENNNNKEVLFQVIK